MLEVGGLTVNSSARESIVDIASRIWMFLPWEPRSDFGAFSRGEKTSNGIHSRAVHRTITAAWSRCVCVSGERLLLVYLLRNPWKANRVISRATELSFRERARADHVEPRIKIVFAILIRAPGFTVFELVTFEIKRFSSIT